MASKTQNKEAAKAAAAKAEKSTAAKTTEKATEQAVDLPKTKTTDFMPEEPANLKDNPKATISDLAAEQKENNDANASEDKAVAKSTKQSEKKELEAARLNDTGNLKRDGLMKKV